MITCAMDTDVCVFTSRTAASREIAAVEEAATARARRGTVRGPGAVETRAVPGAGTRTSGAARDPGATKASLVMEEMYVR